MLTGALIVLAWSLVAVMGTVSGLAFVSGMKGA